MITVDGKLLDYVKFPDGTYDTAMKDKHIKQVIWHYECDIGELLPCLSLLEYNLVQLFTFTYLPYARQDKTAGFGGLYPFLRMFEQYMRTTSFTVCDAHNPHSIHLHWFNEIKCFDVPKQALIVFPDESAYKKYHDKYIHKHEKQTIYFKKHRNPDTGDIDGLELCGTIADGARELWVIDDICDGGQTFIKIADYFEGRYELHLRTTYGIYSKGKKHLYDAGYKTIECQHLIHRSTQHEHATTYRRIQDGSLGAIPS